MTGILQKKACAAFISYAEAAIINIISPIIIHQSQLLVIELTTPLNRLGDVAGGGYLPIGGVGVGGADVAGGAEDLAHVFGEVEAIGVPGAVFLDGERAGRDKLGGIPRYQPQGGMIGAGEVATSLRGVAALAWQAGITGSSRCSGQSLRWWMV